MKQIIFITVSFVSLMLNGQNTASNTTETPMLQMTGFAIYLEGGVKPLRTEQSTLFFHYVDESPSRDNITETFDMPSSMYSASLRLGAEYEFPTPFFVKLQLEGYLAKISGFSIDGGVGYAIKNRRKTFSIRPQLLVSSGLTILPLGNIYQNDLYIEVNGTQFYSNSVSTSLRSRYLLLIPQLECATKVADNLELRFSVEVPLPISKGDPYVYFSGADRSNNQVDATESINVSNMDLYLNKNPLRSQNINFTFPGFHIGLAYKL
jgi:hypothetical protein